MTERELEILLKEAGRAGRDREAPPHVEERLLEAFRRSRPLAAKPRLVHGRRILGGRAARWAWIPLAAAAALLFFTISARQPAAERPVAKRTIPETPRTAAPEPVGVQPARTSPPAVAVRAAARPAARQPRMIATEFLPLVPGEGMEPLINEGMDGGQIVRMRVPSSVMRNVGLPVRDDRLAEPVLADMLLGQDGTARGIRFVKFAQ